MMLQFMQPGLDGWMDGSVSTLAPLFASFFASGVPWSAFLVGLSISIGGGISMALAEALSDTGEVTGRGLPWVRGGICGAMTAIGGILPTLPFLLTDPHAAFVTAIAAVAVELMAIAYIRVRYLKVKPVASFLQVVAGGAIVLLTGAYIGGG